MTTAAQPSPHLIRRMYDWVLSWAEHRHANTALFLIAFAEASFFPIPPDVLLIAMAVGAPHRALQFALVCTAGSVLGGICGYAMGWGIWSSIDSFFYQYIPNFNEAMFNEVAAKFGENTFIAVFTAGFTPIPFKVFTIAAGAAMVPFGLFVIGSLTSRGLRFLMVAGLIRYFGPSIKTWIDRYFNILTIVFTILLIGGIIAVRYLH